MGLLSQGSPLNWEETKKYADHIRKHGIIQFLNIYNKLKDRQKDVLKWGDEVRMLWRCVCDCVAQRRLNLMLSLLENRDLSSSTKVTFWNAIVECSHM